MFLTKECDYAIRVVRELADSEIKSVGAICEREKIPHPFAYKILKKLERAGIVDSRRGAAGGYRLTRATGNITLFDIINAVDERLVLNDCLQKGYVCIRNPGGNSCGVHCELIRVQNILMETLKEKTMDELI